MEDSLVVQEASAAGTVSLWTGQLVPHTKLYFLSTPPCDELSLGMLETS